MRRLRHEPQARIVVQVLNDEVPNVESANGVYEIDLLNYFDDIERFRNRDKRFPSFCRPFVGEIEEQPDFDRHHSQRGGVVTSSGAVALHQIPPHQQQPHAPAHRNSGGGKNGDRLPHARNQAAGFRGRDISEADVSIVEVFEHKSPAISTFRHDDYTFNSLHMAGLVQQPGAPGGNMHNNSSTLGGVGPLLDNDGRSTISDTSSVVNTNFVRELPTRPFLDLPAPPRTKRKLKLPNPGGAFGSHASRNARHPGTSPSNTAVGFIEAVDEEEVEGENFGSSTTASHGGPLRGTTTTSHQMRYVGSDGYVYSSRASYLLETLTPEETKYVISLELGYKVWKSGFIPTHLMELIAVTDQSALHAAEFRSKAASNPHRTVGRGSSSRMRVKEIVGTTTSGGAGTNNKDHSIPSRGQQHQASKLKSSSQQAPKSNTNPKHQFNPPVYGSNVGEETARVRRMLGPEFLGSSTSQQPQPSNTTIPEQSELESPPSLISNSNVTFSRTYEQQLEKQQKSVSELLEYARATRWNALGKLGISQSGVLETNDSAYPIFQEGVRAVCDKDGDQLVVFVAEQAVMSVIVQQQQQTSNGNNMLTSHSIDENLTQNFFTNNTSNLGFLDFTGDVPNCKSWRFDLSSEDSTRHALRMLEFLARHPRLEQGQIFLGNSTARSLLPEAKLMGHTLYRQEDRDEVVFSDDEEDQTTMLTLRPKAKKAGKIVSRSVASLEVILFVSLPRYYSKGEMMMGKNTNAPGNVVNSVSQHPHNKSTPIQKELLKTVRSLQHAREIVYGMSDSDLNAVDRKGNNLILKAWQTLTQFPQRQEVITQAVLEQCPRFKLVSNVDSEDGKTLLHIAVANGWGEVVMRLLSGAKHDWAMTSNFVTPQFPPVFLSQTRDVFDKRGNSCFLDAIEHNDGRMVALLLKFAMEAPERKHGWRTIPTSPPEQVDAEVLKLQMKHQLTNTSGDLHSEISSVDVANIDRYYHKKKLQDINAAADYHGEVSDLEDSQNRDSQGHPIEFPLLEHAARSGHSALMHAIYKRREGVVLKILTEICLLIKRCSVNNWQYNGVRVVAKEHSRYSPEYCPPGSASFPSGGGLVNAVGSGAGGPHSVNIGPSIVPQYSRVPPNGGPETLYNDTLQNERSYKWPNLNERSQHERAMREQNKNGQRGSSFGNNNYPGGAHQRRQKHSDELYNMSPGQLAHNSVQSGPQHVVTSHPVFEHNRRVYKKNPITGKLVPLNQSSLVTSAVLQVTEPGFDDPRVTEDFSELLVCPKETDPAVYRKLLFDLLNFRDQDGRTLLSAACSMGLTRIVEVLLGELDESRSYNSNGGVILSNALAAAAGGDKNDDLQGGNHDHSNIKIRLTSLLRPCGFLFTDDNVNAVDLFGKNALHYAIARKEYEICNLLFFSRRFRAYNDPEIARFFAERHHKDIVPLIPRLLANLEKRALQQHKEERKARERMFKQQVFGAPGGGGGVEKSRTTSTRNYPNSPSRNPPQQLSNHGGSTSSSHGGLIEHIGSRRVGPPAEYIGDDEDEDDERLDEDDGEMSPNDDENNYDEIVAEDSDAFLEELNRPVEETRNKSRRSSGTTSRKSNSRNKQQESMLHSVPQNNFHQARPANPAQPGQRPRPPVMADFAPAQGAGPTESNKPGPPQDDDEQITSAPVSPIAKRQEDDFRKMLTPKGGSNHRVFKGGEILDPPTSRRNYTRDRAEDESAPFEPIQVLHGDDLEVDPAGSTSSGSNSGRRPHDHGASARGRRRNNNNLTPVREKSSRGEQIIRGQRHEHVEFGATRSSVDPREITEIVDDYDDHAHDGEGRGRRGSHHRRPSSGDRAEHHRERHGSSSHHHHHHHHHSSRTRTGTRSRTHEHDLPPEAPSTTGPDGVEQAATITRDSASSPPTNRHHNPAQQTTSSSNADQTSSSLTLPASSTTVSMDRTFSELNVNNNGNSSNAFHPEQSHMAGVLEGEEFMGLEQVGGDNNSTTKATSSRQSPSTTRNNNKTGPSSSLDYGKELTKQWQNRLDRRPSQDLDKYRDYELTMGSPKSRATRQKIAQDEAERLELERREREQMGLEDGDLEQVEGDHHHEIPASRPRISTSRTRHRRSRKISDDVEDSTHLLDEHSVDRDSYCLEGSHCAGFPLESPIARMHIDLGREEQEQDRRKKSQQRRNKSVENYERENADADDDFFEPRIEHHPIFQRKRDVVAAVREEEKQLFDQKFEQAGWSKFEGEYRKAHSALNVRIPRSSADYDEIYRIDYGGDVVERKSSNRITQEEEDLANGYDEAVVCFTNSDEKVSRRGHHQGVAAQQHYPQKMSEGFLRAKQQSSTSQQMMSNGLLLQNYDAMATLNEEDYGNDVLIAKNMKLKKLVPYDKRSDQVHLQEKLIEKQRLRAAQEFLSPSLSQQEKDLLLPVRTSREGHDDDRFQQTYDTGVSFRSSFNRSGSSSMSAGKVDDQDPSATTSASVRFADTNQGFASFSSPRGQVIPAANPFTCNPSGYQYLGKKDGREYYLSTLNDDRDYIIASSTKPTDVDAYGNRLAEATENANSIRYQQPPTSPGVVARGNKSGNNRATGTSNSAEVLGTSAPKERTFLLKAHLESNAWEGKRFLAKVKDTPVDRFADEEILDVVPDTLRSEDHGGLLHKEQRILGFSGGRSTSSPTAAGGQHQIQQQQQQSHSPFAVSKQLQAALGMVPGGVNYSSRTAPHQKHALQITQADNIKALLHDECAHVERALAILNNPDAWVDPRYSSELYKKALEQPVEMYSRAHIADYDDDDYAMSDGDANSSPKVTKQFGKYEDFEDPMFDNLFQDAAIARTRTTSSRGQHFSPKNSSVKQKQKNKQVSKKQVLLGESRWQYYEPNPAAQMKWRRHPDTGKLVPLLPFQDGFAEGESSYVDLFTENGTELDRISPEQHKQMQRSLLEENISKQINWFAMQKYALKHSPTMENVHAIEKRLKLKQDKQALAQERSDWEQKLREKDEERKGKLIVTQQHQMLGQKSERSFGVVPTHTLPDAFTEATSTGAPDTRKEAEEKYRLTEANVVSKYGVESLGKHVGGTEDAGFDKPKQPEVSTLSRNIAKLSHRIGKSSPYFKENEPKEKVLKKSATQVIMEKMEQQRKIEEAKPQVEYKTEKFNFTLALAGKVISTTQTLTTEITGTAAPGVAGASSVPGSSPLKQG
ncbi:unnamed protein product [Amoebophrya sp. A120]|nr:unnamed protein product [Amoebophrya sp. A120]|eukprot:GSA120T00000508001.1